MKSGKFKSVLTILLPGAGMDGAQKTAHRILEEIRAQKIEYSGADIFYTVSIGVASLKAVDDLDAFVSRGDAALYEAKKSGRNRICTGT